MTDPNVIEAMNLLSAAVCSLATKGLSHKPSDAQHAIDLADEASELLAAAAEKPAEKPAEAAPVVPALPWEVRRRDGSRVIARCESMSLAEGLLRGLQNADLFEVAAAAPVVPVKFNDDGDAMLPGSEFHRQSWGSEGAGTGWLARIFHAPSSTPGMRIRLVDVMLPLRPGEDAGVTTATILAACGRGL